MKNQKFARSLDEAFGPYTGHHITETVPRYDALDWAVIALSVVVTIGVPVLMLLGVL